MKHSDDGKRIEVFEAKDGKWIPYAKLPSYTLNSTATQQRRGQPFNLSSLRYKSYCWIADDGYNNFSDWVG